MKRRPLLTYFVLVFVITWSVGAAAVVAPEWFDRTWGPLDSSNPLFFLAVYAPTLTAIGLTAAFEGRAGLRALAARLDPRRGHPVWFLVVIGGFLALTGIGAVIGERFGGPAPSWNFIGAAAILGTSLIQDPGPLGEELGWRGFALPRMLRIWSPVKASLILGVIWGVWHLPAFYVSTLSQSQLSFPVFILGAVSLSVVTSWLFLRSKGSVLIAILTHLMANHAADITGGTFNQLAIGMTIVAVIVIATGQFRAEPAAEHQLPA